MPLFVVLVLGGGGGGGRGPAPDTGLAYYLNPDFSKIWDITILNAALGQAFFSLSLGMGAMITYGSYLSKQEHIATSAMWVVLLDTSVALLAGFIIFPAGFSIPGFDPGTSGPGLIFTVLPRLFDTLPGGHLFGAGFFVLLMMAALTSTISLLEVPVAHLIDAYGWTRQKAVVTLTILTAVLAVPSALSNGASPFLSSLPGVGMGFLDLMATVWNEFALPIGGLMIAIFVGYVWPVNKAVDELRAEGAPFPGASLWAFLIRFVCPIAILLIIVFTFRSLAG
jgi:NSS family neurotransmitter:Na+ symporter